MLTCFGVKRHRWKEFMDQEHKKEKDKEEID